MQERLLRCLPLLPATTAATTAGKDGGIPRGKGTKRQ
jgi:hypothetical protein